MRPSILLAAVTATALGATLAWSAPAPSPVLRCPLDRVAADERSRWELPLFIVNTTDGGLYGDSLLLVVEDLDPGQTHAPRTTRTDLSLLLRTTPSLSSGDSAFVQYGGPASCERARLTLTLHSHGGDGRAYTAELKLEADPGTFSAGVAPRTLSVGGRKVETEFVPAEGAPPSAPGVLLVHDDGGHSRRLLPLAHALSQRGYAVMLVSLPGYGVSEGAPDFAGPASVAAAAAALDDLAKQPGVDPKRLGVWGQGRGAGVAASLAATRADLRALVVQAGVYDLWAVHRGATSPGLAAAIVAEAGRDSAGWRARSPLLVAAKVRAATLLVHGDKDADAPTAQAHAFAAALQAAGTPVESKFLPGLGHRLPDAQIERLAFEFLDHRLRGDADPK